LVPEAAAPAGRRPATLLHGPRGPQHRMRRSMHHPNTASAPLFQPRSPDPASSITRSSRTDGYCLPALARPNRYSAPHRPTSNFPRVPSLEGFGRRPRPCSWHRRHIGPSSETLT
jgi:hypothetical protein